MSITIYRYFCKNKKTKQKKHFFFFFICCYNNSKIKNCQKYLRTNTIKITLAILLEYDYSVSDVIWIWIQCSPELQHLHSKDHLTTSVQKVRTGCPSILIEHVLHLIRYNCSFYNNECLLFYVFECLESSYLFRLYY